MTYQGDSDAMIIKGLVALLVRVYSGHPPEEVLASPPDFIRRIGMDDLISPTRSNGLAAMVKKVRHSAGERMMSPENHERVSSA